MFTSIETSYTIRLLEDFEYSTGKIHYTNTGNSVENGRGEKFHILALLNTIFRGLPARIPVKTAKLTNFEEFRIFHNGHFIHAGQPRAVCVFRHSVTPMMGAGW